MIEVKYKGVILSRGRLSLVFLAAIFIFVAAQLIVVLVLLPKQDRLDAVATTDFPVALKKEHESSSSPLLHRKSPQHENKEQRELALSDLILGEFIHKGSCNIVAHVRLPDWWHQQQQQNVGHGRLHVDNKTKLVIKIAVIPEEGDLEIQALRVLNNDEALAAKHKILPLVWSAETFDSPFYAGYGIPPLLDVPESWPRTIQAKLHEEKPKIAVLVVPHLDRQTTGIGFQKLQGSRGGLRRFMRSLMSTLDYAHSLGINNHDLSEFNVFCDGEGDAIVADWNWMHSQGQDLFHWESNFKIMPPEAIIEKVPVIDKESGKTEMKQVKQTSVGAVDIWSAGLIFADELFYPCSWLTYRHFDPDKTKDVRLTFKFVKNIIRSIGGNAKILVNSEGDESDLAAMVSLDSATVARTPFRLPICEKSKGTCRPCRDTEFSVLNSDGEELGHMAIDFLEKMMVLTPQDRPTAKELLKHPFLDY